MGGRILALMMQSVAKVARQSHTARQVGRTIARRNAFSQPPFTPTRLRLLSTTSGTTVVAGSSSKGLAIAFGTALVGLGSYYAGSSNGSSVSTATTYGAAAPSPSYGTQEDFKRAIRELEVTLEGMVSTDPANLSTHGFSPNVMHEGE